MDRTTRTLRGKKLLVGAIGVGTLTFAACAVFPGCNLAPPPPCPGTATYSCYDQPDLTTTGKPVDGSADAALGDGSMDAMVKGD